MRKRLKDGAFIVVEGPEGTGKTTQFNLLKQALEEKGLKVVARKSPGGTPLGEEIRQLLLSRFDVPIPPIAELFLFLADRNTVVEQVIKTAIREGAVYIGDRFDLSTMAYQIGGRGLPEKSSLEANKLAKAGCNPDLYILLMSDFETAQKRSQKSGKKPDKIEQAGDEFHRRVHSGYMKFAKILPNVVVVDAAPPIEQVHEAVMKEIEKRFEF